jgi:alpha-mannosidase
MSFLSRELPCAQDTIQAEFAYAAVKPENVVFTALKKAEDSNALIFSVYEWAGKSGEVEIHVPNRATHATATNLMEKPEG